MSSGIGWPFRMTTALGSTVQLRHISVTREIYLTLERAIGGDAASGSEPATDILLRTDNARQLANELLAWADAIEAPDA